MLYCNLCLCYMRLTLLGYPSKIGKNFNRKRGQDSLVGRDVKQGNYGKL